MGLVNGQVSDSTSDALETASDYQIHTILLQPFNHPSPRLTLRYLVDPYVFTSCVPSIYRPITWLPPSLLSLHIRTSDLGLFGPSASDNNNGPRTGLTRLLGIDFPSFREVEPPASASSTLRGARRARPDSV